MHVVYGLNNLSRKVLESSLGEYDLFLNDLKHQVKERAVFKLRENYEVVL